WFDLLNKGPLPTEVTREAAEQVFRAVHEMFQQQVAAALPVLGMEAWSREQATMAVTALDRARRILSQLRAHMSLASSMTEASGDLLAEGFRRLALYYSNVANEPARALHMVESALAVGSSEGLRVRLQRDATVLGRNAAFAAFEAAIAARDY